MVVVGIIGVLASAAMGAYTQYISVTKAGKVAAHFTEAHRSASCDGGV